MTAKEGRSIRTLRRAARFSGPRAVVPFLIAFAVLLPVAWRLGQLSGAGDERVELQATYREEGGRYLVDVSVKPVLVERVVESVEDGRRAEVSFGVRHYGTSDEFWGILGDTLIEEVTVSRTLSFDPFSGSYRVQDSLGYDAGYDSVVEAVRELYRVSEIPIPAGRNAGAGDDSIRARAVVNPMVLARPLFLARPLLAERTVSAAWVEAEPAGGG
ncbi:MAG: DUF4390 domain-containing protein, partial [Spirochaetota bacterium]